MKLESYSKIYNVGTAEVSELFSGNVTIEEKIDGSSISFGIIDGELMVRTKGSELDVNNPEKMFSVGVSSIKNLAPNLHPNWIYRGEFLQKPKHNVLVYDRVPKSHVILYDIGVGEEKYLTYDEKAVEANRIGLEIVPLIYQGSGENLTLESYKEFLNRISILGGVKIEGVVIKNYSKLSRDGKVLMGKHVSEDFKEVHRKDWKHIDKTTSNDVLALLIAEYRSKARWQKAVLHLEEAGLLTHSPKDIGIFIKEIHKDIEEECANEIKDKLWNWAKNMFLKGVVLGAAEFYKEKLLERQVEETLDKENLHVVTSEEISNEKETL